MSTSDQSIFLLLPPKTFLKIKFIKNICINNLEMYFLNLFEGVGGGRFLISSQPTFSVTKEKCNIFFYFFQNVRI